MIKGILFDMDTLINAAEHSLAAAWRAAAKQLQLPLAEADIAKLLGTHESERADVLHTLLGKDGEELQQLAATLREAQSADAATLQGLCAALRAKGVHTAFTSTKVRTRSENYLSESGLQDAFDVFVTGVEFINRKPAPDMYDVALIRLRLQAQEAMLVASEADAATAAAALHLPLLFVGGENETAVVAQPTLADAATWLKAQCTDVPQEAAEEETAAEVPAEDTLNEQPAAEPAETAEPAEAAEVAEPAEAAETEEQVEEPAAMGFAEFGEFAEAAEPAESAEVAEPAEPAEAAQHVSNTQQWPSHKELEDTVVMQLKQANLLEEDTEVAPAAEQKTDETASPLEKAFEESGAKETDAAQGEKAAEKPAKAKKEKKPKKEKEAKAEGAPGAKNAHGAHVAAVVGTVVVALLVLLFGAGYIVCHGPSVAARDAFVVKMEASGAGFVPRIFLSEGEIAQITAQKTPAVHQPVDLTDTGGETSSLPTEDSSSMETGSSVAENTVGTSADVNSTGDAENNSTSDSAESTQQA